MKRAGSVSGTNATPNAAGRPRASSVLFGLVLLAALAFPGGCNNYNLSLENFFSNTGSLSLSGGDDVAGGIDFEDFGPVPPDSIIRIPVANAADWGGALVTIQNGGTDKNYVITLTDDVSLTNVDGLYFGSDTGVKVSLRGAKTISLAPSYSGSLLNLAQNQILILREATLQGRSGNSSSMVIVNNLNKFFMRSGTISGNSTGAAGGGVYVANGGEFTMSDGTISGNSTTSSFGGGGVYVMGGSRFTMSGGAVISGNNASNGGGGVYVTGSGSTLTMSGGTISGNYAVPGGDGGGVWVDISSGDFIMNSGTISGNHAAYNGGGVYFSAVGKTFTMIDGTISGNYATDMDGGGVHVISNSNFTMIDGIISGNHATGSNSSGGGVSFSSTGSFAMSGSAVISDNTTTNSGGGVYVTGGSGGFAMYNGTISGNTATNSGGGVWVNSGSSFDKTGGTIYGDTDTTHLLGDINNTVTAAGSFPTSGNAVYYAAGHYRDGPLGVWDDIHTSATGSPWDD